MRNPVARPSGRRRAVLFLAGALTALAVAATAGCADTTASATPDGAAPTVAGRPAAPARAEKTVAGQPAAPGPCALLTSDEVTRLIGAARRSGPTEKFRGSECAWQTGSVRLAVIVFSGSSFYAPDLQATKPKKLTGVGDEAFVSPGMAGARIGETVIFVYLMAARSGAKLEQALRLAVSHARTP